MIGRIKEGGSPYEMPATITLKGRVVYTTSSPSLGTFDYFFVDNNRIVWAAVPPERELSDVEKLF